MSKKSQKGKKQKSLATDLQSTKNIQEAISKEGQVSVLSPEWMAGVEADISISPIPDANKAVFLYAIAQGTFNDDLHGRFIDLLAQHQLELKKEEEKLLQQVSQLQAELRQTEQALSESTVGACKEVEAAVDHIEIRTAKQVETLAVSKESSEIESIKAKLKKQ